jgi:cell shape-determining protein MreC
MENRFQDAIDQCTKGIKNCDKQIKSIKFQNKFAMILITCALVVIITALFIGSYGLALFMSCIGVLNYVINSKVQGLLPNFEEYKKSYRETIARYEELELQARQVEDVKRRVAKLEEPVPQVLSN